MKLDAVFIVFLIVVFTRDARGEFSFDSIKDILFPRNPEVNRVRRIEDANGDPYAVLDTVGLVEQHGYPAEEHKLTTKDGYNLVFFRVPGSPKSPPTKGKPVVYIQHGMTGSSDYWVLMGPGHDLVFLLADAGYDVWLGNIRGNTYCRSNTNLSTTDKEFWNFSWQEGGTIDVPSMIDYALDFSGQKSLFYIGHSMGTTMIYVLLSERPEYNNKMRFVVSLAPVGYFKNNLHMIFSLLGQYAPLIHQITRAMDVYDLLPQSKYNAMLGETFCTNGSPMQPLCLALLSIIMGKPGNGFNITILPYLIKYAPAGVSTKTAVHYAQCFKSGVFKKYDYGSTNNLKIYGTKKPPVYDFSKISAPFSLFYGNTDELAIPKNVIGLSKELPNLVTCEKVPAANFNHVDFVFAANVKDVLYNRIMELFSKY